MNVALDRRRLLAMTATGVAVAGAAAASPAVSDAADPAINFAEVNGARLAYQHYAGNRLPPLVFLHGYALRSTGQIYSSLIQKLRPHFDIYALDMRGHGGSAAAIAGWSQEAIADDVAAFAKEMELQGAVFAGHSLGGFTGMYAQIRRPGLFSSLMLLATSPAGGGGAPPSVRDAFIQRGRDPVFLRDTFAGMYRHPGPRDIQRSVDAVTLVDPKVHDAFYSNFAMTKVIDRLSEIDVPVLVVSGARDSVVSPADQYDTALKMPNAKEVTLPDQGHMLPIEAADVSAREMLAFFGQRSAASGLPK